MDPRSPLVSTCPDVSLWRPPGTRLSGSLQHRVLTSSHLGAVTLSGHSFYYHFYQHTLVVCYFIAIIHRYVPFEDVYLLCPSVCAPTPSIVVGGWKLVPRSCPTNTAHRGLLCRAEFCLPYWCPALHRVDLSTSGPATVG
jgi:hypothetical protein